MDLGFVKFKSNGTKAKGPLEQLQKAQRAKKQKHFFFSLGVLQEEKQSNSSIYPLHLV